MRYNLLPVFRVDEYNHGDIPISITIKPVRTASANISLMRTMMVIGDTMRKEVLRAIQRHRDWSTQNTLRRTTGYLQMNNMGDARHAHAENVRLEDMDGDKCMEIFELATGNGSNPDLNIYEVEWCYYINRGSIEAGAAKEWTNTENFNGLLPYVWKDAPVGCAIIEFTNGYVRQTRPNFVKDGFQKGPKSLTFKNMCIATNEIFGDGENVMTTYQLLQIVELPEYLEWRIVILYTKTNYFLRFNRGHEYELNNDPKIDKTIYIFHDISRNHFVYVSKPKAFLQSAWKNNNRKFCHKCLTSFVLEKGCRCQDSVPVKYKPAKLKQCSECGVKYTIEKQHVCHHYKCKHCELFHKRQTDGQYVTARCPLYKDDDTFSKKFDFEEEKLTIYDAMDGSAFESKKSWALLVYDLESALVVVEDEQKDEYEVDENGDFVYEDGDIVTYRVDKQIQCPNFAVVKDVGTDELWTFDNMTDFVTFCLVHNEGRNICLAHNASGYDSRLVFEEVSKNTDVDVSTTMNGGRIMTMTVGKTKFQDTMLHLKGSLKKLAEGFKLDLKKGHFPHLFNKAENYNYIGPIPDKRHFDLSSIGSQKDMDEFHEWYDNLSLIHI